MIVGSVVTLRAGGPRMTVQAITLAKGEEELTLVKCIYIDQQGQLTRPIFPQDCLQVVEEDKPNV